MRILFAISLLCGWLSTCLAIGSVGWRKAPPQAHSNLKIPSRYAWLKDTSLFFTVAYTPDEVELTTRFINATKKPDERDALLSEMIKLGYIPTIASIEAQNVVVIIPPSALSGDKTLALIELLNSLSQLQARLSQEVRWYDLSEEARSALMHLIEAHFPYAPQRRQQVLENLDQKTVLVRYEIDFRNSQGVLEAIYIPNQSLPLSVASHGEETEINETARRTFVSSLQRCVALISVPVNSNLLHKLMHEAYPAALNKVLEAYKKQFQERIDTMLQPLLKEYRQWLGRQVSLSEVPRSWREQASARVNPKEPFELSWCLTLCIKSPSMPSESKAQVGFCIPIAPIK